jgi:hypothetical protein
VVTSRRERRRFGVWCGTREEKSELVGWQRGEGDSGLSTQVQVTDSLYTILHFTVQSHLTVSITPPVAPVLPGCVFLALTSLAFSRKALTKTDQEARPLCLRQWCHAAERA